MSVFIWGSCRNDLLPLRDLATLLKAPITLGSYTLAGDFCTISLLSECVSISIRLSLYSSLSSSSCSNLAFLFSAISTKSIPNKSTRIFLQTDDRTASTIPSDIIRAFCVLSTVCMLSVKLIWLSVCNRFTISVRVSVYFCVISTTPSLFVSAILCNSISSYLSGSSSSRSGDFFFTVSAIDQIERAMRFETMWQLVYVRGSC